MLDVALRPPTPKQLMVQADITFLQKEMGNNKKQMWDAKIQSLLHFFYDFFNFSIVFFCFFETSTKPVLSNQVFKWQ